MANQDPWYMSIGGQRVGPVSKADIEKNLQNGSADGDTLLRSPGMSGWKKLREIPDFSAVVPGASPAHDEAEGPALRRSAHEIDYTLHGSEMQFVEIELDPGESAVAEAGAMMYMTGGINFETIFGDGSQQQSRGVMDALLGAGKRILTGESLFMTVFTNQGQGRQRVAFGAPYPGKILPMDLRSLGGQLICQKDSFLCAARGVSVGIAFQKKLGVGIFGGEGFIMQKLEGDGLCFVHAGGTVHSFELGPGETMRVDTGCLVALQPSVNYDIQFVGKLKSAFFGGEGLFFATLTGPGRVWLQSLPFSRLAQRIYASAPQTGGWRKEEGSILDRVGGLGDLIDGR
jgi:uncharacterized protein (TIGR00266 family)